MIIIKGKVVGNKFELTDAPLLASGGRIEATIELEFSPDWDEYTKAMIFYSRKANVAYRVLIVDNKALVPWEVEQKKGSFFMGVEGIKGESRYTTELICYNIAEGAREDAEDPIPPTPDIYDQILAIAEEIRQTSEELAKKAKSAYEIALEEGFVGTKEEWLASLHGADGITPNIQIGEVETLDPDEQAYATITGTTENPLLNLGIPKGEDGQTQDTYTKEQIDDKIHELNQYVVTELDAVDESIQTVERKIPTFIAQLIQDDTHQTVTNVEKQSWNAKVSVAEMEEVLGEVEQTLHDEIESATAIDDETISRNSDNELQSIGTVLINGGVQKYWRGTKQQFNAIANKEVGTLYEILDDEETALFEVDGSSVEFSPDMILRVPNNVDLMFQSVLYGGGESGYRKYRNGMLEQWGVATSGANGEVEFNMHQAHIDQNFSIFIEPRERGNFYHYAVPTANQKFAMRVQTRDALNIAIRFQWRSWGRWK